MNMRKETCVNEYVTCENRFGLRVTLAACARVNGVREEDMRK
jgi:hypothetical protein